MVMPSNRNLMTECRCARGANTIEGICRRLTTASNPGKARRKTWSGGSHPLHLSHRRDRDNQVDEL
jgi:hypothetical protein